MERTPKTLLATRNEAYGFFGTIALHTDPTSAWDAANAQIQIATGCGPEGARDFLDSRDGRHFADTVSNHLAHASVPAAIDAAIRQYQGWRISRRDSREFGIPTGLPYLTGWATHYDIMAEEAE